MDSVLLQGGLLAFWPSLIAVAVVSVFIRFYKTMRVIRSEHPEATSLPRNPILGHIVSCGRKEMLINQLRNLTIGICW